MLDIKFIRDNPKLVEEKAKQKGFPIDLKKLLTVDEKRKKLIEEVDHLRSKRKEAAEKRDEKIGSKLKKQLHLKEDTLEGLNEEFYKLIRQVPNLPKDDVPVGASEKDNQVVRVGGKKPSFDFKPKDHLDLGLTLDLIDVERAAKISGTRFSYIKNELVSLEFAIIKFTIDLLTKEGFTSIIPPVIINPKVVEGLGYPEYLTGEGYKVDDQYLTGTAEHSIVPMHMDEVFAEEDLPKRYVGFSTAFRREAGSYGKDTKGIFRLHQFDKVEMVSYVLPKDEGKELQYLVSLQEKMVKELDLPYRLLLMCTGELGFPIAKKYDIEIWLPSQEKYRETHSASTTSDFQARRLNIKYRSNKETGLLYTLNATAFAIGRTLIAIMENHQQADGSIKIPQALHKYLPGGLKVIGKKKK